MSYKKILQQMLKIYRPPHIDWMGWEETNLNYYTFHHIEKKICGGENKKANGAILTVDAHQILHILEIFNYDLYTSWNDLFYILNKKKKPLELSDYEQIMTLKNETDSFINELNNERVQKGKSRIKQKGF